MTLRPRKILVPVDFSEPSDDALDYASALAGWLGGTLLCLVHCIPTRELMQAAAGRRPPDKGIEILEHEHQAKLDPRVARASKHGISAIGLLRDGPAPEAILRVAEEQQADLIVMATHGRKGLRRAVLGSVAEQVVRTSPIPVLTVRPQG